MALPGLAMVIFKVMVSGLLLAVTFCQAGIVDQDPARDAAMLARAGIQGQDDARARQAWQRLSAAGPAALPAVLAALKEANPVGANWLLTAAEAIVAREFAAGRTPPRQLLENYLHDRTNPGRARRVAFEWLTRMDPALRPQLLPKFLDDPSLELRRDAVQQRWEEIDATIPQEDRAKRTAAYLDLIRHVREQEQAEQLYKLIVDAGGSYDLTRHFGFITSWHVIGPFDHTGVKAFHVAYPPESTVDLAASYEGKNGQRVSWQSVTATGTYANVDLNQPLGKLKGVIGYAATVVESPQEQPVEIRVGSVNAIKIFLNGELLLAHEEYHHGAHMDQYIGRGRLKAGRNTILLKVCQNEQTESYAALWGFQCRLCDATGGAVPFTLVATPTPAK
jgi:hypothetical protein